MKNTYSRKPTPVFRFLLALWVLLIFCAVSCARGKSDETSLPSVEQMAAQMLMIGFYEHDFQNPAASPAIIKHIKNGRVGNVILFEHTVNEDGERIVRNIENPQQVKSMIRALKAASPSKLPLWIAIDQEGGAVQRLKPARGFKENYPAAKELGAGDVSVTKSTAKSIGSELAELGIDFDFAPVVDVDVNPDSPAIGYYERSFSENPQVVANHALAFIDGLLEEKITPCIKHFPGHGSAEADTHDGFTDVTNVWSETELEPYKDILKAKPDYPEAGAIMIAHVFNSKLDAKYPASLSKKTITGLLRGELGWNGVVVSDDLHMGAITQRYSLEETIFLALDAGADLLVFSRTNENARLDADFPQQAHKTLVNLVKSGKISKKRLYESYERLMLLKLGLHG